MWRVISASVIGAAHVENGLPCQDDCFAEVVASRDGDDVLVCLVADGAGSAINGGRGAEIACLALRGAIEAALRDAPCCAINEATIHEWIDCVRGAISKESAAAELSMRDYACTLLGAVVWANGLVSFQVGDGGAVAWVGNVMGVLHWPESGPYANMTYFVTDDDVHSHLHVEIVECNCAELAMFSDGIQRLALSFTDMLPYEPFFAPMMAALRDSDEDHCQVLDEHLARFLGSSNVNQRTDDDKTLILATRRRT